MLVANAALSNTKLSDLGILANRFPFELNADFVSYEVNASLWTGDIEKNRWVKVPANEKIKISDSGAWEYPEGTLLVKNFSVATRNLETRIAKRENGKWNFTSYRWDKNNTDAYLITQDSVESIVINNKTHQWTYPSEQTCIQCHSNDRIFGFQTEQLNLTTNTMNQLDSLVQKNILNKNFPATEYTKKFINPYDETHSVESRARVYMHISCSTCHSDQGSAPGGMDFDYKLPIDLTGTYFVLASMGTVDGAGDFRILPGDKEDSVVWRRIKTIGHKKMSPIRPIVNDEAVRFIGKYIDQLN